MLASDPLSLTFLGCMVFSAAFLLVSLLGGVGHGHLLHAGHGAHAVHLPHVAHIGATAHGAQAGHIPSHAAPAAHAPGHAAAPSAAHPAQPAPWTSLGGGALRLLASSLNLFSALTFLFVFGLFGDVLHNAARLGSVRSIVYAAGVGLLAAVVVGGVLEQLFASDAGVLTQEDSRLEGRIGRVSMAIRAGGVGEVIYARPGAGRQSIGARSADGLALAPETEVVILAVRDGIATVQGWDDFIRSVRAGEGPALEPLPPET